MINVTTLISLCIGLFYILSLPQTSPYPRSSINRQIHSAYTIEVAAPLEPSKQKMLFQEEYLNSAWGYHRNGWYVDTNGAIYVYDYQAVDKGLRNVVKLRSAGHVSVSVLALKRKLIAPASHGDFQRRRRAFDAGKTSLAGYLWKGKNTPQRIELREWGDTTGINTSKKAQELTKWLTTIAPVSMQRFP